MASNGNLFIRRPIFAMVIGIVILLLGLIAMRSTPIEQYPDLIPPMVQVTATYQGADALNVEQSVATPIEEAVNGVSDMIYMESTNSNDGEMTLQVTFAVGSDPDLSTVFTQNRVGTATSKLPSSVVTEGVSTVKTTTSYVLVNTLYSDGRYDEAFLSNYAILNLKDPIARVNGVGNVLILGGGDYAMRVWLEPDLMDYYGFTIDQISEAIEQQSVVISGGDLGAAPVAGSPQFTYTVLMPPQKNSAEEFEQIILRSNSDGSKVVLSDVARVELGSESYEINSAYKGNASIMMIISQSPGSNAVEVGREVGELMEELAEKFPPGMEYTPIVETTKIIKEGIHEILFTLLFALLLVVLVIYLFLQDPRATLVPVISIPVSLVGAFILFPALGFSVNTFSLLALVLAIGLVVDDAIVVVEAVQLNIERGMKPREASLAALRTVTPAIVAMTTVLMAVFLPVGLMGGATGKLYQQFAITIALSVGFSGINALTLTPALCAVLLRANTKRYTTGFFGWFNRTFKRSVSSYTNTTERMLHHAGRTVLLVLLIAVGLFFLVRHTPTGLLPDEDQGYLMANIQLPDAASLARTQEVITEIEQILYQNEAVDFVSTAAGYSLITQTSNSNSGALFILLKPYHERKQSASELANLLNGELYEAINGGEVFIFSPPSIPGLGTTAGFSMMIQDRGGNTPDYLAQNTARFLEAAQKEPAIGEISTMFSADVPQKAISIDNAKVLSAGVSLSELHNKLSTYLGGTYVNNFIRFGRMYDTYIQAAPEFRMRSADLQSYSITNSRGESIPLSAFITITDTVGVAFTNRFNLYRSAAINGTPAPGYSSDEAMEALERIATETLPTDMGYAWSGMSYQEQQSKGSGVVLLYAILFVFLILAALYESWSLPLSILMGIPFALFGAMLFIFTAHLFESKFINDIFLQVSLILLIGLSAKNAILIVAYAKDQFDQGAELLSAAIEGAKLRIRPVVMTAAAFIMGVVPLILASGSNSIARNVMGVALFGGMLIATIIGLFVYPVLFVWIGKLCGYEKHRKALELPQDTTQNTNTPLL